MSKAREIVGRLVLVPPHLISPSLRKISPIVVTALLPEIRMAVPRLVAICQFAATLLNSGRNSGENLDHVQRAKF